MAFIPTPQTARAAIEAVKAEEPVVNVIHFRLATVPGPAELQDLADTIQGYWASNAVGLLPGDCLLQRVVVTDMSSQIAPERETAFAPGTGGAMSGQPLPNHNSKLVQFNTGNRGRSARGGVHWFGLTEDVVAGNNISSTFLTNLDLFWTNFFAHVQGVTGWVPVVNSLRTNGFPRAQGVNFDITEISFANTRVGSMVGRLR